MIAFYINTALFAAGFLLLARLLVRLLTDRTTTTPRTAELL